MKYLYVLVGVVFLFSCTGATQTAEVKDGEFFIQASYRSSMSDSIQEYKVRVFPGIKKDETIDKKIQEQMLYHVDSCFYRVEDGLTFYPLGITPIANGLKNCFEYLVVFADGKGEEDVLHYADKYMSKKNYQLNFK